MARFAYLNLLALAAMKARGCLSWAPPSVVSRHRTVFSTVTDEMQSRRSSFTELSMSEDSSTSSDTTISESSSGASSTSLTDEEWSIIQSLHEKADDEKSLNEVVLEALPTISPKLLMKLRQGSASTKTEYLEVAAALESCLDTRLQTAAAQLQEFLAAGEIRKLDSMIGKAAREGSLDVAFFQVLTMNLQDAAANQPAVEEEASEAPKVDGEEEDGPPTANRAQILQHIYTRCQEEVEKTIPPGVALLNKVLRTPQASIRENQLNHYLCPQPNVIKTPDGKELELKNTGREKVLVPHADFVEAIANTVRQIRTVEQAGGVDREGTANMVESVRQVAKEARIIIGTHYGRKSKELEAFEESLYPVFRPSSPESPYIKGD